MSKEDFILFPNLKPFQKEIQATKLYCLGGDLYPDEKLSLWDSKVGGFPYLPKSEDYPKDVDGNEMFLLAQINFSQVPKLDNFPQSGILQFFISEHEEYGLDFENPQLQDHFKILFYPETTVEESKLVTDFSRFSPFSRNIFEEFTLPHSHTYSLGLNFTKSEQYITLQDLNIELCCPELDKATQEDGELDSLYSNLNTEFTAQVGGYPFFCQSDVRKLKTDFKDYILLFQLNSNEERSIMWGDFGVANFFIHPEDLTKKNFSKVIYNWDGY